MSETVVKNENSELLTGHVPKLFWKYALLSVAGIMFSCLAVIIDGYFMGNAVGELALGAISICITLMYFCMGLCAMFGVGASTLAGIKLGQGKQDEARTVYGSTLLFALILAVVIGILSILFLNPLLRFLGATEAILPYARAYGLVFFSFLPFSVLGQIAYYFCRLAEKPRMAAIIFVASGLAAILVEYIMVFKLHIETAASATDFVIGVAGTVLLIPYLQGTSNPFKLKKQDLKIRLDYTWESIKIGFPMFLFNLCPLITTVIINRQLIIYGGNDLHIAAFGIFNAYIVYVMNALTSGLTAGIQPIASVNYGANENGRIKQLLKTGVGQSFLVLLALQVLILIAARPCVSFFAGDAGELIDLTVSAMRIYILVFAFGNVSTLVGGYYIGIENNKLAILNSTTRVLIFAVPMLFLIPKLFGLNGVWMAQPFADALACIIAVICLVHEYKRLSKNEK